MLNLIFLTLLCSALVVGYSQLKYRIYLRSVKKGIVGKIVPYRTPSKVNQFCKDVNLICSELKAIWRK